MFEGGAGTPNLRSGGGGGPSAKILVSNLDYGVSDADIKVSCLLVLCTLSFFL